MLSTSLVLMSGVSSVIASTGADFGTIHTSTRTHLASPDMHLSPEFQNSPQVRHSERSFSTVILGLDPRIQVKQGFLSHLDASVRHWHDSAERLFENDYSAGIPRHEAKASARDDKSFLAAGIMLEQRASGQHPSAANRWLTASVCFVSDTQPCSGNVPGGGVGTENSGNNTPGGGSGGSGNKPDYTLDNYERCAQEGYTQTSCPAVKIPSNRCPYNKDIFEECVCRSNWKICQYPGHGVGEACKDDKGYSEPVFASCETYPKDLCIVSGFTPINCPANMVAQEVCPHDSSYGRGCMCPPNWQPCNPPYYGVGQDCNGKYASCELDKPRACKENGFTLSADCPSTQQKSGFCPYDNSYYTQCVCKPKLNETDCKYGTYSCPDGCGGTRTCCKVCDPNDRFCQCPGYTYCGDTKVGFGDTCSVGDKTFHETCLVTEGCSEVNFGCKRILPESKASPDFINMGAYCMTHTGTLLNTYLHCACSASGIKGKCVDTKHCVDDKGHQKDGSTEPCMCNGVKRFEVCDDACDFTGLSANGGSCEAVYGALINSYTFRYYVKNKCTTQDGTKVYYAAQCNEINCEGKPGPCYGKKACRSSEIAIDPCECGRVTYGSSCVIECPYEETEYTCSLKGMSFTQRCKDNDGTWFGECK